MNMSKKNTAIFNDVNNSSGVNNKADNSVGIIYDKNNVSGNSKNDVNNSGINNTADNSVTCSKTVMHTGVTDPYAFKNIVEIVEKEDGTFTVFTAEYENENQRHDNGDPGPFEFQEVQSFSAIMKRNARRNFKLKGFDFDVDTFENLIDAFVEKETVPVLLGCCHADLDRFCRAVYGVDYNTAYPRLLGIADMWMRKAVTNLATSGNATALGIASKHFMKLSDEADKNAINITINNDYKIDEEDK